MDFHKNIVVIGCSRDEKKAANFVPKYLSEHEFEVYCVNPFAKIILKKNVYKKLEDVPKEAFEMVDVFRPSEEILGIAEELIRLDKLPKVFWMQEGIKNQKAKELLESRGVRVIEDTCIMKAHKGEFNS
ncbi:MAG: CoA-binding protein [Candidatus Altiarchaeota archaeon]|nr:CoA-binding protein [Candidatus Altiarchaeota archaeon]